MLDKASFMRHFFRIFALTIGLMWATTFSGSELEQGSSSLQSTPRSTIERIKAAIRYNDPQIVLPLITWPRSVAYKDRLIQAEEFLTVFNLYAILQSAPISDQVEGNPSDYAEEGIEIVGSLQFTSHSVPIRLERTVDSKQNPDPIWRVSSLTLEGALNANSTSLRAIDRLIPNDSSFAFLHDRWWGISLWQWFAAGLVVLISSLFGKACAAALEFSLKKIAHIARWPVPSRLLGFTFPLSLLIATIFFRLSLPHLGIGISMRDILLSIANLVQIYALTLLLIRAFGRVIDVYETNLRKTGRLQLVSLMPPIRRVLAAITIVIALIFSMRALGYDVSALLAGLGVGGLAIALAAQKTVENLFGGLSVVLDQPVRVGEFCRAGDVLGTVEDIGLRSTRIRTLDRTLVTIPNADFSQMTLENYTARDSIRFVTVIGVRYDTTADQVRLVLHKLRELLEKHEKVLPDPRVRFINFGSSALEIEIFCFLATSDFSEFLGYKEEINLKIMDILLECGTECAFNTSVQYNAPLDPLPANLKEKASHWVKTGQL